MRNTVPLFDKPKAWENRGKLIGYLSLVTGKIYTRNGNPSENIRGDKYGRYINGAHERRLAAAVEFADSLTVDESSEETDGEVLED